MSKCKTELSTVALVHQPSSCMNHFLFRPKMKTLIAGSMEMGKEIEGEKKRKKRKFGEYFTFDSTKSYKLISKTQFDTT